VAHELGRRPSAFLMPALLVTVLACAADGPDLYADRAVLAAPRTVRFDATSGVPIVEVEIDGQGPFRLVFDTGAAMLVLDQELVERLALPRSRFADPVFVRSIGGHADTYFRRVGRLRVGSLELTGIDVAAVPLDESIGRHVEIDGLLGLGAFYHWVVAIDYEAATITFSDGPALPAAAPGVVAVSQNYGLSLYVEGSYEGRRQVVRLDTGASPGLLAGDRFLADLPAQPRFVPYSAVSSPTGRAALHAARLADDLSIGVHVFRRPIALVARDEPLFVTSGRDWAALLEPHLTLGHAFLRQFRLVIDQRSARVQLTRSGGRSGAIESPPLRAVLLGAPMQLDGKALRVVDPGRERPLPDVGRWWNQALKPGDRIVEVAGRPTHDLLPEQLETYAEGEEVPVTVEREAQTFQYAAPVVTVVP
jgi:hypothetical protein